MQRPKLSFIVPTINRRDSLLRCLRSVAAQRYPNKEIVVVDDNSSDGSQEAVLAAFPDAIYILNPSRVGLGPALQMGSQRATGDIWISLDDDGYLATPDDAEKIARYFEEQPDLGAVAFKVEAPDGSVRHREIPLRSKRLPETDSDVAYFNGGAVAFRATALTAAGGYPDVEYYSWEQDVSFRFCKAGYRILFSPEVRFVHLAIPSPQNTGDRESGYVRIQLRLAATYLPAPHAQVHALLWILVSLAQASKKGHFGSTARTVGESLSRWKILRADKSHRLSIAQTSRLTALSGRTWY